MEVVNSKKPQSDKNFWILTIVLSVIALIAGGFCGYQISKGRSHTLTEMSETSAAPQEAEEVRILPSETEADPATIEVASIEATDLNHVYEQYLYDDYKQIEPAEASDAYYYTYYDIDHNGREELLVGTPKASDHPGDTLKSIYVYNGDKVVDLLKTSNIGQDYNKRMVDQNGHVTGYTEYGKIQRVRVCPDGRIIYTMKIENYPTGTLFVYKLASNGVSLDNVQKYSTEEKNDNTFCSIPGDNTVDEQSIGQVVGDIVTSYDWKPVSEVIAPEEIYLADNQDEQIKETETPEASDEPAADGYDTVIAELTQFFRGEIKAEDISVAALREPVAAYNQLMRGEDHMYNGLHCSYAPSYLLYDVSGDGQDDLLIQMYTEEMSSHLWGVLTIENGKYVFVKAPEKYAAFNRDDDVTWPTVASNLMWQSQYTGDGAYCHVWVGYAIQDGKLVAKECYGIYGDGESSVYHTDSGVPLNEEKTGIDFSQMTSEHIDEGGKTYVSDKVSDATLNWVNFINE